MTLYYLITLALSFILTVISVRYLIPVLKSRKMGQKILDIGPRWHKSKEGTPTMGGLSFLFVFVVLSATVFPAALLRGGADNATQFIITIGLAFANGLIGMIDDRSKLAHKQNEGLKAWQKYLLQLIVCGFYLSFMEWQGYINTAVMIPFTGYELELGPFYYFFATILITGVINSVNLADGIDGLASTETAVVTAFFSVAAFTVSSLSTAILSASALGLCLGFLVYNFYPARVFMGDTGSLFLGGLVIGLSFMINNPLIIVVVGIMYIIESVSVILQVIYFKLTNGKRLFKMSPIHHHFEKCGWSEIKIVSVFSFITLVMCIIAYYCDIRII